MSDSIKLTPALPVVPPLPPAPATQPDMRVEPVEKTRPENRTADNGNARNAEAQAQAQAEAQAQSTRSLTITRQEKLGGFIYRSIDDQSGEVIWQYPADSILRLSQALRDMQKAMDTDEGRRANQQA